MLPATIYEMSAMLETIERTEAGYNVRDLWFGEVRGWCSLERLVLECRCRESFILTRAVRGRVAIGHRKARELELEKHSYSWLEGSLERLEGKEARQEYYVRLEERALAFR